jgi:hypothetical protein
MNSDPPKKKRKDDTGVFYQTITEARSAQHIANKILRATINQTGAKRVVIATRNYDRAENIRKLLVEKEVADSISIATSATAVHDYLTTGKVTAIVAEQALADQCVDLLGDASRVFILDGQDEETVAEVEKIT